MTKQELSQCYWINREIEQLTRELEGLDGYKAPKLDGMPRSKEVDDSTAKITIQRAELHRLISLKIEECMIARARIERYINTVDSSEIRMILRLRHINGLTWEQMAAEMNYSDRHLRRLYHDFFA